MKNKFILILAVIFLAGCAQQIPPLNFSVPNVGVSSKKIDAELKSVTVTLARPDEAQGDLPLGIETITPMWKEALTEALNRMAIFQDDASQSVSLSVKVLGITTPSMGITFPTDAVAKYELTDRQTGALIYTETIHSNAETPMSFAFLGITRQRESVNRSVQNNISKFLMALEDIDINRPMFDGR